MALTMMHDKDIDSTKYYSEEIKNKMKKENEGRKVCPIMSISLVSYSGRYTICLEEKCAIWNDGCAFCK